LIFFGHFLRRSALFGAEFWIQAEKLIYYVFFPCLLVSTLAKADLALAEVLPLVAAIDGAILGMVALSFLLKRLLAMPGPRYAAFVQAVIRYNTYLALALAFGLYGEAGLELAAVGVIAIVPLANLVSVAALVRYGERGEGPAPSMIGALLSNPLILSCIVGLLMNVSGIGLPPVLGPMLDILGRAALGLGLLSVGASLTFASLRVSAPQILLASALKLLLLPAMTAAACRLLGVEGVALAIAVVFTGQPTAVSSYIITRHLGGDHGFMAAVITAETALAILSIPLVLAVLM
jgi:predicted permease